MLILRQIMIERPPLQNKLESSNQAWVIWFEKVRSRASAISESGTTANRPNKGLWVGRPYFDTDLGYIIHLKSVNPSVWVNGAGTTV